MSMGLEGTYFSEVWIKNTNLFIQENAFQSVASKMVFISFLAVNVLIYLVLTLEYPGITGSVP